MRIFPSHLMLVSNKSTELSVLVATLDACFEGTSVSFHRIDAPLPPRCDIHVSDTINIGPYKAIPTLNVLAISPWLRKGSLIRFQYVLSPDSGGVVRVVRKADAFMLPSIGSERLSYTELVRLGTSGRRAVWAEYKWDSDDVQINRMDCGSSGRSHSFHSVLLPPDPGLPFKPRECRSIAFDEATGRLCLGLYNGNIYVLDYA